MPKANDSPKAIREAAWARPEGSNRDSARGSSKTELDLGRMFWGKWIGILFVEIACLALIFAYRENESGYLFSGIVTGLAGLAQWLLFRMYLKPWWIVANVAAGYSLGALHNFLFNNTGWSLEQLGIILALWGVGNFLLALLLIRDARSGPPQLFPTNESGARKSTFLTLLSVSLLIAAICNVLLVWDLSYETLRVTWMLYAAAAILTSLSFLFRNDVPRNIGFITLALFLALDGINVALLALDSAYPPYFFALNGMVGLLPGIFFAFHKATWKNMVYSLLVVSLIANSVANLVAYNTDLTYVFLIISSVFGVSAAVIFLMRK